MAMLTEWVEPKWQRRRGIRPVHVVAVLCAVLAAAVVVNLFKEFGVVDAGPGQAERQLIGTVDLRLGTPALAAERAALLARADIEAGILKLQTVGPKPTKADVARAHRMEQRYGVIFANKSERVTPETQAFVDSYNQVMREEIERRLGKDVAEGLMGFDKGRPRAVTAGTP
ncbi:MAG: hypothetical protein EOP39_14085 [Rubrivivax sp.]|nr:MAG: hypothetical protein EOP39_14085 [Rubrivivax sp.]